MFPRKDIRPGVVLPHLSADLAKLSPEYWINVQSNLKKSKEGWLKNSEILVSDIILTDNSHTKCNSCVISRQRSARNTLLWPCWIREEKKKQTPLCGPANLVNHMCVSYNSKFEKTGIKLTIRVIRPLKEGEEVLVNYPCPNPRGSVERGKGRRSFMVGGVILMFGG